MKRLGTKIAISTIVAVFLILAGWASMYPAGDPKNIRYVLWKVGLCKMDLDLAASTMVGDAARDKLIVGKTDIELRHKFGYLLPRAAASLYLKTCSEPWKERKVLFIRNSP